MALLQLRYRTARALKLDYFYRSYPLTNSTRLLTATPLGPLAIQLLFSSIHATPAMSRWIHGVSSTNSFRNIAAVTAPPQRPPELTMSAMPLLIISWYSWSTGSRHIFSPERIRASENFSNISSLFEKTPALIIP